jgi:hypothetical protein
MIDIEGGIDENYLVPEKGPLQLVQPILGVARQPVPWVAVHLRAAGALVASEILVARVGVLTAHISRLMPGLIAGLRRLNDAAEASHAEVRIGGRERQAVTGALRRSHRWQPPSLPQRALRVYHCGWSSLRSAQALARVSGSMPLDFEALSARTARAARESQAAT